MADPIRSDQLDTLTTAVEAEFAGLPAAHSTEIASIRLIWSEIRAQLDETDEQYAVYGARLAFHAVRSTAAFLRPPPGETVDASDAQHALSLLGDDFRTLNVLFAGNPIVKKPKPT